MIKGALVFAQSGGPTAVINASACGVFQEAMKHDCFTEIYAARYGIDGVLNEDLIDVRAIDPVEVDLLKVTPASAFGSCRHKLPSVEAGGWEYDKILALPGIGEYTAGAISSICFEQPTPAVDGNVIRVLSRYAELDEPMEKLKKELKAVLTPVYPIGACGDFTQALMELGATVCVPNGAPLCEQCPLKAHCAASLSGTQLQYPVKAAKKSRRQEERTVFVLHCGEKVALCKRPEKGLLAGLWQLPDVLGKLDAQEALHQAEAWGVRPTGIEKIIQREHIFTHVHWHLTGIYLRCSQEERFLWVSPEELKEKIGLPTAYRQFLKE